MRRAVIPTTALVMPSQARLHLQIRNYGFIAALWSPARAPAHLHLMQMTDFGHLMLSA
jgi:hypothetical protein